MSSDDTTRRDFLKLAGASAAGLMAIGLLPGCEAFDFEAEGTILDFLTEATDGNWYWQSGNGISKEAAPDIAASEWRMDVRQGDDLLGEVDFALLEELAAGGAEVSYWKTMRCVYGAFVGPPTNTFVANGIFTGVPLYAVLAELGLGPDEPLAKIRTSGADGFASNIPWVRAWADEGIQPEQMPPLLATSLNGLPLSRLRGGPVRLIIPEMYGFKNVKWLDGLTLTDDDSFYGIYETQQFAGSEFQGYIDDPASIALASVATQPGGHGVSVEGPDFTVAGVSFVGDDRIDSVEVSLDDGPFEPAVIDERAAALADLTAEQLDVAQRARQAGEAFPWPGIWVTWTMPYTGLSTGEHRIVVRAAAKRRRQSSDASDSLRVAPELSVAFTVT